MKSTPSPARHFVNVENELAIWHLPKNCRQQLIFLHPLRYIRALCRKKKLNFLWRPKNGL